MKASITDNGNTKPTMMDMVLEWRDKHITDRQMTIILALFIGFFASVAAFILHFIIKEIQVLLTAGFTTVTYNWLYLVFPVIGIFLTSLFVRYVVNISHGITRILYAISSKRSRLKPHNCWTSVIASAITIGFGGSVGAEAPIVLTGSSIGSNLGQLFKMDNKTLMLLVGCGAAAAIAGIFKAPIAGLVFTLEVLMVDLSMASLLPILVASVTATCFTYIFMGSDSLFSFHLDGEWIVERVPACILLGVSCGLVSLYFIRMMTSCEGVFARLKDHRYAKQQQHRSRLEHPAQQLAVLRSRTAPHHLCGVSGAHQGGGHVSNQRRRRLRRNVCPLSVCRSVQRISLCPYMEHTAVGSLCA